MKRKKEGSEVITFYMVVAQRRFVGYEMASYSFSWFKKRRRKVNQTGYDILPNPENRKKKEEGGLRNLAPSTSTRTEKWRSKVQALKGGSTHCEPATATTPDGVLVFFFFRVSIAIGKVKKKA